MNKTLKALGIVSLVTFPGMSQAEFIRGFADIGIHYLDWSNRTTESTSTKSHKDDFGYLELGKLL